MAQNKKYDLKVTQHGDQWSARILRRVSASKTTVTKEQTDFSSEADARAWGQQQLIAFTETQQKSNLRHGVQRERQRVVREQRSQRRTDKTRIAKAGALETHDTSSESHEP